MRNYDVCVSVCKGRKEVRRQLVAVSATSRFNAAIAAETSISLDRNQYARTVLVKEVHENEMAYSA